MCGSDSKGLSIISYIDSLTVTVISKRVTVLKWPDFTASFKYHWEIYLGFHLDKKQSS